MKKFLAIAAASAAMLVSAYAAEMEGVIKEIDAAAKSIVLEDGTVVAVAEGVDLSALAAGAKVKLTIDDASKAATAVEAVE